MSWNLPRIINNLEAEINTGYVHDPATRNFSMGDYDITNINLVKCEDIETRRFFSVNDELDKLDNFEATTTNPDVTTIIGKLKIDNIDTNIIYSADELTRIELDDSDINLISQNLTWNGLDLLTSANLETLQNKTFYIDGSSISPNGTIFSNYIYADKYIINGATGSPAYLLSDGSTIAVSGQNSQSNIYLYRNSTVNVSPPDVGEVRFNNPSNVLTTTLWISHITHGANGVDIDVFLALITSVSIIYLQEADNSLNYIKYNVTANPVIVENTYITLQVSTLSSGGSGASNFGNVDLIMSIFTNDTEIDGRITAVETKTQNVQATSSKLTVNRSTELLIDDNDFLAIRSIDAFLNYLILTPTEMNLYTDFNLNANALENVGSIKISGFETSNFFLKSDGTLDENDYLQATDSVITNLQNKTQLISTGNIGTRTVLSKSSECRLTNLDNFSITLLEGLDNITKFIISGVLVNSQIPMTMTNNRLYGIPTPIDNDDCANKLYVDNAVAGASGTLIANSSTFINSLSKLQSSTTDKFCQSGVDDLQTIINVMNANDTVYLSSGTHTISVSPLNISITDISLSGAISPVGTQTTTLNYNVVLNNTSTRVKFKDIYFQQLFRFAFNGLLRMDFENCKFGAMEFQDSVNYVNFTDCEFTTATLQFPFVGTPVYTFTRCNMNNAIINPNISGMVILDSCKNVESLTQVNTIYKGINTLTNGNTQLALTTSTIGTLTVNSITQAGLSPYFRQASQIATVITSGTTETIMTTTANFGSYSWADTAVGQSRTWKIHGIQTRGGVAGTYTIRFKSGTLGATLNVQWALPASPAGAVSNLPFILELTTVRTTSASLFYYAKFTSVEATTAGYYLYSSQNNSGGVLGLNALARYNITVQSSVASCTLQFNYIEVLATLN